MYSSKDDQYVAIVGGADANFQRLVEAMQDPAISDPRFKTPVQRSQQADELNALVRAWAATLTIEELETRCLASGVPFGRVFTARDLSNDPHVTERGDDGRRHPRRGTRYPAVAISTIRRIDDTIASGAKIAGRGQRVRRCNGRD